MPDRDLHDWLDRLSRAAPPADAPGADEAALLRQAVQAQADADLAALDDAALAEAAESAWLGALTATRAEATAQARPDAAVPAPARSAWDRIRARWLGRASPRAWPALAGAVALLLVAVLVVDRAPDDAGGAWRGDPGAFVERLVEVPDPQARADDAARRLAAAGATVSLDQVGDASVVGVDAREGGRSVLAEIWREAGMAGAPTARVRLVFVAPAP